MNFKSKSLQLTIIFFLSLFLIGCTTETPITIENEGIETPITNIGIIKEDKLNKIESASQLRELIGKESQFNQDSFNHESSFQTIKTLAVPQGAIAKSEDISESSGTNNQVSGVDEADIVKTNGDFLFVKSNNDIKVISTKENKLISTISSNEKETLVSFFIKENKVIAIYNTYKELPRVSSETLSTYTSYDDQTLVKYFDIKAIEDPKLKEEFEFSGRYYQARLIDNYFYLISSEYLRYSQDIPMPTIYKNNVKIAQPETYYFSIRPSSQFYTITSMDISNPDDFVAESYLLDSTATVYVSKDAIYMGYQKRINLDYIDRFQKTTYPLIKKSQQEIFEKHIQREDKQAIAVTLEEYLFSLSDKEKKEFQKDLSKRMQEYQEKINAEQRKTVIQKITIGGTKLFYHGSGEVEGRLLNQFSLDESQGYLRVATTTSFWLLGEGSKRYTNVFVMDENLEVIGSIEKLAEDETMYSSRFLGDRLYLVTFKQIDPLFVIDLSEPTQPRVEGKLKIPGFSTYLHPYGETYLIGVGKETEESVDGRVQTIGVKLSLFDVNNMNKPIEVDKSVIGDKWTSTPVEYDHKAFLFDPKSRTLALPVKIGKITEDYKYYPRTYEYFDEIYKIDETGLVKLGEIEHKSNDEYWSSPEQISRTILLNSTLYSISETEVSYSSISNESVETQGSIDLGYTNKNNKRYPVEPYLVDEVVF